MPTRTPILADFGCIESQQQGINIELHKTFIVVRIIHMYIILNKYREVGGTVYTISQVSLF